MLPAEIILGTLTAGGALLSAIFGGGLFKQYISHSNQMAVQKHDLEQTKAKVDANVQDIQDLKTTAALQSKDIESFAQSVKKLEMLPEINSKLSSLEGLMTYLKEQIKDFRSERMDHDKHS